MRNRGVWRGVAAYYAMACGVSWALWSPRVLGSDGLKLLRVTPPVPVFISLGTLGPLLACYMAPRLCEGNWQPVQFLPWHARQWLWVVMGPLLIVPWKKL